MILSGTLWLLTWPLVIIATYFLVRWALKYHESKLDEE